MQLPTGLHTDALNNSQLSRNRTWAIWQQRLDTLESFMDPAQTPSGKIPKIKAGIEWKLKVSSLYSLILMLTI